MKKFKKLLFIFLGIMVAFFLFLTWYKYRYSMEAVAPYEINSPSLEKRLLIATQGSAFKDSVTNGIVDHYTSDSIYLKVIDIEELQDIDPKDFDALAIIHTWENWKPPKAIQSFIEKYSGEKNKMVLLTTSGEGSYKIEDVDAIAGESIVSDAPLFTDRIIERLNALLDVKAN